MTMIQTYRSTPSLLVAITATLAASTAALAQPANDLCASAQTVTAGSTTNGTNVAATSDIAQSSCSLGDSLDVWYSFTAGPSGGQYTIDTEGTVGLGDTTLSTYGSCGGAEMQCDDDAGTGLLSSLFVTLTPSQNIKIRVAGYAGATGAFRLNISNVLLAGGTDLCPGATVVVAGSSYLGDNSAATSDLPFTSCSFTPTDNIDVWFSFTPASTAFYRINTNGSPVLDDTTLAIFSSCGGTELFCDDDSGAGFLSELNVLLNASTNYRIRVAGWDGGVGQFLLNIGNPVAPPSAPPNDNCTGAVVITTLPFRDNTTNIAGATNDADLASCNDPGTTVTPSAVWYRYTPASNRRIRLTEATFLNNFFSVFTSSDSSCGGVFAEVAGSCGFDTIIDVTGGTTYFILVGAAGLTPLPPPAIIDLNIVEVIPPTNDACSTPQNIPSIPASVAGSNVGATSDIPNTSCSLTPTDNVDVWYRFTAVATVDGTLIIDTEGSTGLLDTTVALYETCGGAEVACDDDGGTGFLSRIVATLVPGNVYLVRVAGYNGQIGAFQLNISGMVVVAGGACCSGSTCAAVANAGACAGPNRLFAGAGTVCNVFGVNNRTPCCLADYNHVGGVGVQDIFDFLAGYFTANPQADINGGGISVQDIFDYLAAYFAGCP